MNITKRIVYGLSTFVLITSLVACGTSEKGTVEPKKEVNGASPVNENKGIAAGKLVGSLSKGTQNGQQKYQFSIRNDKEKEEVLKYSSTQEFDYTIKDQSGVVVYTYSMDKMFAQTQSEKVLKPGEIINLDIDLTEDLKKLKPGTYQLEVWSSALEQQDLRAETQFNWGGVGEGLEEEGKLKGFTVTYVGLMDNNSIEVINEAGEYEHYRLSEKVKPDFDSLNKDDKITIYYIEKDGQKIIEQVTKE
ncbi:BsuPI-related putative proteinase inhibitor [Neobacillus sp. D3-1R]|uniref:BsuPI-related putative proteinase inhibitor n=1 Tax=Neobacillus sp. D3-1R TaxID=3445778 RepID=UPI003F9F73D2